MALTVLSVYDERLLLPGLLLLAVGVAGIRYYGYRFVREAWD